MAQEVIDVGQQPNDGQGDPLRSAFEKTNTNFTELFNKNRSDISNGSSNINILEDSVITMSVDTVANVVTVDTDIVTIAGNVFAGNLIANDTIISYANTTGLAGSFMGNVEITGNLSVTGNSVSIGSSTLSVNDPIINLHTPSDLTALTSNDGFDIGIVYNNATELRFILENLEILPQQHSIALATA